MSGPFRIKGVMTVRAACELVVTALAPDEGIGYAEALAEVRALTEWDVSRETLVSTMGKLTDDLHAAGGAGMRTVANYGWVRETARDMLAFAEAREARARTQTVRMGVTAKAINPGELTGEERLRRDAKMRTAQALEELIGRRARRLRPMPPALGA